MNNRIRQIAKVVDQAMLRGHLVMITIREEKKPLRALTIQREQLDIFKAIYGEENINVY